MIRYWTFAFQYRRYVAQIADALITTEGDKNLSALYRNIVGDPCLKAAADTFREAPWTADDTRVPLRAKTIRRLNRHHSKGERLTFRSKIDIAWEMLEAVSPLIPADYQVTLLCDSWYAAVSILKWCRSQSWHVICRLKSAFSFPRDTAETIVRAILRLPIRL